MKKYNLENESGRSMIEMLGVLAIIGVLSVGGIAGYSKAMMKYRINKTIEQITLIAGNVRSFFAPQRSYDGFHIQGGCGGHCEVAHKAKLVPEEMMELDSDGRMSVVRNEFGGIVVAEPTGKNSSTDKQAFTLEFRGIPPEACIELLSQDWTNLGKTIIVVGGIGCGGYCPDNKQYFIPPVNIDDAVSTCSRSGGIWSVDFYIDVDPSSTYWQGLLNPSS